MCFICLFWFKKGARKNKRSKSIIDSYPFLWFKLYFWNSIKEKMRYLFRKKKFFFLHGCHLNIFISNLPLREMRQFGKQRLEIMTFPNLEGDKIIFVYPLFDSQFVIK